MANKTVKLNRSRRPINQLLLVKTTLKLSAIVVLLTVLIANFPSQFKGNLLAYFPHINISEKLHRSVNSTSKVAINLKDSIFKPKENEVVTTQQVLAETVKTDNRTEILQKYFAKKKSPLVAHAKDFIEAADTYQIDWKLVAAISGVESTFGKNIPGGNNPQTSSFNGWGWGVYGSNVKKFNSWREGIFTVSKGLKERYINKGLITPYQMNRIYASSPTWGTKVDYFLKDIDSFAFKYSHENLLSYDSTTGLNFIETYITKEVEAEMPEVLSIY